MMLIIQSLFSRLRNIQTRNRGRIVIPASAPPARERPRCGWIMIGGLYSKRGEGWMRPTFVLQHLHFLVSLLIHTRAVRKGKFGCYRHQNQYGPRFGCTTNLAVYFLPLLVHTSCRIMRNASSMLLSVFLALSLPSAPRCTWRGRSRRAAR